MRTNICQRQFENFECFMVQSAYTVSHLRIKRFNKKLENFPQIFKFIAYFTAADLQNREFEHRFRCVEV